MQSEAFFDTNVLLYALASEDRRTPRADALLEQGGAISVQVLNEFAAVARRKLRLEWHEIAGLIAIARRVCAPIVPLTLDTHGAATRLAERYRLSFCDDLIVASALNAGFTTLWTEDMQDGQVIDRLTIRNPFS